MCIWWSSFGACVQRDRDRVEIERLCAELGVSRSEADSMPYAVQKLEDCQRRLDSAEAERDRLIAVQSKIDTDASSIEADFAGASCECVSLLFSAGLSF